MTDHTKSWKLKLNFKPGLPNLEKEVNRVYYKKEVLDETVRFYMKSDLLKDNCFLIEEENVDKIKIGIYFYDISNKYSF